MKQIVELISKEAVNLKESILVIDSQAIPDQTKVFPKSSDEIYELIQTHGSYQLRNNELEADTGYKQVIPYLVVKSDDRYLFSSRTIMGTESRLRGKSLIGFGGHVRAKDVEGRDLLSWGERELSEELDLGGQMPRLTYLALFNSTQAPVDQFHVGILILVEVEKPTVQILESEKFSDSQWLSLDQLKERRGDMEAWSQLVLDSGLI